MIEQPNLGLQDNPDMRSSKSFRMIYVSILAAVIGVIAGLLAYALFSLIGLLWNLVFFQQVSTELTDLEIAKVLTYARVTWGNKGKPVQPTQVTALRVGAKGPTVKPALAH